MDRSQHRPTFWSQAQAKVSRGLHHARLLRSIRRIHGPSRLETAPEDVIVVALVRDGQYYLDAFFSHYRSIGARHFVFIDNGSTDSTIERIVREPDTIIIQSHLPWGPFENDFRRHAAQTYCADRWCLFADMDEQFDFEASQTIGLSDLVRYLNATRYTALVAQMLEMFPDVPLRETAQVPYDVDFSFSVIVIPAISRRWIITTRRLRSPTIFRPTRWRITESSSCLAVCGKKCLAKTAR